MADVVSKAKRSSMMANIGSKNTTPELLLRKGLHRDGFRFRLHDSALPGTPDIKFTSKRAVIFVHGCFWHQHETCHWGTMPASRRDFWQPKLGGNAERDRRNVEKLIDAGWRVGLVWECSLRPKFRADTIADVADWLRSTKPRFESRLVRTKTG